VEYHLFKILLHIFCIESISIKLKDPKRFTKLACLCSLRRKKIIVFRSEQLLCTQCSSPLYVMDSFPQNVNLTIACAIFRQSSSRDGCLLLFTQADRVSFMMQHCSTLSLFYSFILLFPKQCTDISRLLT
jgi:hypothetical protein